MKQYLLLFKSSDFNKSGNIWTTNPINLYTNSQYSNYSYTRSQYGLDLIGDRTYVGTEITSPSYGGNATPYYSPKPKYVTDVGEIVRDSATPSLERFIDTTSRVDVLSYRHIFTNIPGTAYPTFNIQMYESDSVSGPWLKSSLSADSNIIFIKNCKPFIKIELEIFSDGLELSTLGLVFYLEIGIHDPIPSVISDSTRNILRRFPSWSYMYEDSIDPATPSTAIPKSVGGKFLNAIVQESLDDALADIDLYGINAFISSANTDMLAWCFASSDVPANLNIVTGDDVRLVPASSFQDFFNSRPTDYVYYYNPVDRQFLTVRYFENLQINFLKYEQEAVNVFNDFDEFGARVGLPRLYLESNESYKRRILDVALNPPSVSIDGFKRTVRRELDLWRAYGATPGSDVAATPIVYEISDIETSTPYFSAAGVPEKPFYTFVDSINSRYPSNFGYVNWGETSWDYGGIEGEGLGRIPAVYDVDDSALSEYYQDGIGDFDDFKVDINPAQSATVNFTGSINVSGRMSSSTRQIFSPILVNYSWYVTYLKTVSNYNSSIVRAGIVYEVDLPAHDNYASPSTFYANLNYGNNSSFYVGNKYLSTHPASPEFNLITVFDQEGLSQVTFLNKATNAAYLNTAATPFSSKISAFDVLNARVILSRTWNQSAQQYNSLTVDSYRAAFNSATPQWSVNPVAGTSISIATPNINYVNSAIRIGSNLYPTHQQTFASDLYNDSAVINYINDPTATGATPGIIFINKLVDSAIVPPGATPLRIYIEAGKPAELSLYKGASSFSNYGGRSYDPETGSDYIIPSSPNLVWRPFNTSGVALATPSYFTTATINYSATPNHLKLEAATNNYYPFVNNVYSPFSLSSTPNIFSGFIDENNNTYESAAEKLNSFYNEDVFLKNISMNKNTFGMNLMNSPKLLENGTIRFTENGFSLESENSTVETVYFVEDMQITTTPNSVYGWFNSSTYINDLNNAIANNSTMEVGINVERKDLSDSVYSIGAHTGYIYLDDKEYYMYYDPFTQSATGRYFSIPLSKTPKLGAPVITKVAGQEYRNIVFEDSATPGKFSFENTEIVKGNRSNSLYLGYEGVISASVTDSYTGKLLFRNLSSSTNTISPFNAATPSVVDREYIVKYKVDKAFHVEKDIFNDSTNSYLSTIYFSTTPNIQSVYSITYENEQYNKMKEINLELNQVVNPLNEGYIYVSKNSYSFSDIKANLSPAFVLDDKKDYMILSIISYDSNGNIKPGQTFKIEGSLISAEPQFVTTNDNGFATSFIKYNGPTPATVRSSSIKISGIGSSTPNGSFNSTTAGYVKDIPFEISSLNRFNLELKAVPYRYNITADGVSKNSLKGALRWKGNPIPGPIGIRWSKARTLYDLFTESNTFVNGSLVNVDSIGNFEIINEITASDKATPGYWFGKLKINNPTEVVTSLTSIGETIAVDDVTIAGDVVYWMEEWDNVHYTNEFTPLPNVFRFNKQPAAQFVATPNFVYRHYDQDAVIVSTATPNWFPERWVPIRRYDQYQAGKFGSTPNYIVNFNNVHPDSKED
jgi:hypothetical protein